MLPRKLTDRFRAPRLERSATEASIRACASGLAADLMRDVPGLDRRRTEAAMERELRLAAHDVRQHAYAGGLR